MGTSDGGSVSVQREIQAPAAAVWALISDVTRMGDWSPETTSCAWIKGASGPAVGARFKGLNKNGSKTWSTVCKVTAADPGRAFVFDVDVGPLGVAEWAYRIEPDVGGTGCTVVETWTDRRGGLVKKLGKPLSGVADRVTHNRAGMETTLARLATAAESA